MGLLPERRPRSRVVGSGHLEVVRPALMHEPAVRLSHYLKSGAAVNIISVVVAGVAAVTPARGSPRYSRSRLTWCVVLPVLSFALPYPTTARRAAVPVIRDRS